jgi:4'-phosphopantetheinyl transferase
MPLVHALPAMLGVELWRVDLDTPLGDALHADLQPQELERAARFAFERDRRRYLNGRHALRALLAQRLDVPANSALPTTPTASPSSPRQGAWPST